MQSAAQFLKYLLACALKRHCNIKGGIKLPKEAIEYATSYGDLGNT